jgi:transglutaminase-like putative cysteine protease
MILVLSFSPLQKGTSIKISLPSLQSHIYINYSNDNFSQRISLQGNRLIMDLKGITYYIIGDNYWIKKDDEYIQKLNKELVRAIDYIYRESPTLDLYLAKMSRFIRDRIKYSDSDPSPEPLAVVTGKKADCIGYSNLVSLFLNAIRVKNRFVKGFYLKPYGDGGNASEPIPHRWIEIFLKNGVRFFYDPQYQSFSSNYIVVSEQTDFTRIRKFYVQILKKTKFFKN